MQDKQRIDEEAELGNQAWAGTTRLEAGQDKHRIFGHADSAATGDLVTGGRTGTGKP